MTEYNYRQLGHVLLPGWAKSKKERRRIGRRIRRQNKDLLKHLWRDFAKALGKTVDET